MKHLKELIQEKLKVSKNQYTLFPTTKEELIKMIKNEIEQKGNKCSLNHIDVSKITDMSDLFLRTPDIGKFNGDISEWDVSNVTNMEDMFAFSAFTGENGDISDWDVSNVLNMSGMFTASKINHDISKWKINPKCDTEFMFLDCWIKNKYKPKKNKYKPKGVK